jgi:hypothetical protein
MVGIMNELPPDMTPQSEAAFFQELLGEDALGVVIRAAARIDYHLIKFIDEAAVHQNALGRAADWTYDQRIKIAVALGLDPRFASPLRAFGRIRNKFAHTIGYQLDDDAVRGVYEAFHATDKQIIQSIYAKLRASFPERPGRMDDLAAQEKVTLYAVALRKIIVSFRMHLIEMRSSP